MQEDVATIESMVNAQKRQTNLYQHALAAILARL